MFLFKREKKCKKEIVRENAEITKARAYLNRIHPASHLLYGREPYHYVSTSGRGKYVRYNFYKGYDKRLIYIVLSDVERTQKEREFREIMGNGYSYFDTIFCDILGDDVQHRFVGPNGQKAYLTDRGTVGEGLMMKDD